MFSSTYFRFTCEYEALGGKKLSITTGDAFLAFLIIYDYNEICNITVNELKTLVQKSWEEFELLDHGHRVELKMTPNQENTFTEQAFTDQFSKTENCISLCQNTRHFCMDLCP